MTVSSAGDQQPVLHAFPGAVTAQKSPAARLVPFVGRQQELAILAERLNAAGRGEGGVMLVSGEPGIGKSRLLGEVAALAQAGGWLVLSGRAYDIEGMPPYLPFVEVLKEHLDRSSDEALATLVSGAPELCLLLPEIRARVPGLPQAPGMGPEAERFRLFEAVSGFLIDIARRTELKGLLVLMDDLQWADRTSVLLMQHLGRKLEGVRLLVAGAYRAEDLDRGHPLQGLLADLARERHGDQIVLPPLALEETSALIGELAGRPPPPSFTSSLHKETGGNPFFIAEIVRHLLELGSDLSVESLALQGIPQGIRQIIARRLSLLQASTNATLQSAAVLGDTFSFDLLSGTSELDSDALTNAVEEAEQAGIIREQRDGYVFAHALFRRTVYDELSLPRRRQNHLRAAEAMEARMKPGDARAELAHHWMLAGRPDRATEHLLRAGDSALTVTAWDEAARHWEAARECMEQTGEPPARRARLLEGLGDLYFLKSFEAHPSVERYVEAATLYLGAGDLVGAARARSRAGRSLAFPTSGFDYAAALEHLYAAETVLRNEPESVELGELYAALAHSEAHALLRGPEEMLKAMRLIGEIAEKLEDHFLRDFLRIQLLHLEGHYLGLQGHLAEGLALEERACTAATAMRDKPGGVAEWPERWHEFLLSYSSDDDSRVANNTGSMQVSRVTSRVGLANFTINCCGWQSLDLNDPVRAREKHELMLDAQGRFMTPFLLCDLYLSGDIAGLRKLAEAGTSALSPNNPDAVIRAHNMMALAEGRWADFRADYHEGMKKWRDARSRGLMLTTDRWQIRGTRVMGELALTESLAREALDVALRSGAVKYEFIFRAELALLLGEGGRLDEAGTHLARCREILAEGEDWRGVRGRLALAEAVFAAASGRGEDADAEFERAVDIFRRLSIPWDEAEAFELWALARGRSYRGRKRQAFVRQKLDTARSVYERIGAGQPWLDRFAALEQQLVITTGQPPFPDKLTTREVEVLVLIAHGRSNREIGEELVLSVRTVERHIANVYLKTGLHSHAQAASYAFAHGLASIEP